MEEKSRIVQALHACYKANVIAFLYGPPGGGKTSLVKALAEYLGAELAVVVASRHDRTDFSGFPVVQDNSLRFYPPPFAETLYKAEKEGRPTILALDEFTDAPSEILAALQSALLDGEFGGVRLKRTWRVGMGNPPEMSSTGRELTPPVANRVLHIQMDPASNFSSYVEAFKGGGYFDLKKPLASARSWSQEAFEAEWRRFLRIFGIYLERRGDPKILSSPPTDHRASGPWPSPRSWKDIGLRAIAAAEVLGYGDDVKLLLLSGAVGDGPAAEFFTFLKNLDLPDPHELLGNPSLLPEREDAVYVALLGAAEVAIREFPTHHENFYALLRHVAKRGMVDMAAYAASLYHDHYFKQDRVPPEACPPITKEMLGEHLARLAQSVLKRRMGG